MRAQDCRNEEKIYMRPPTEEMFTFCPLKWDKLFIKLSQKGLGKMWRQGKSQARLGNLGEEFEFK